MHRIVFNRTGFEGHGTNFDTLTAACHWALDNARRYSTLELYWFDPLENVESRQHKVGEFSYEGVLFTRIEKDVQSNASTDQIFPKVFGLLHSFTCAYMVGVFLREVRNSVRREMSK